LKFFLRYAILAPSIHNTQPWSFRIENNNTIELYADRKRALPVLDPIGRELTISCGIVLGYLQITISIYDENGINITNVNSLQKEDIDRLFGAIPKRRTSGFRFRFEDRAIPEILRAGFYYIVDKYPHCQQYQKNEYQDPIWLHKDTLADLVTYGDDLYCQISTL
jgi:hypothetical protein